MARELFQLLKRERIRRQVYPTRNDVHADVFNYIEMSYNPKRRHGTVGDTSPLELERRYSQRLTGVQENPGDSSCQHRSQESKGWGVAPTSAQFRSMRSCGTDRMTVTPR